MSLSVAWTLGRWTPKTFSISSARRCRSGHSEALTLEHQKYAISPKRFRLGSHRVRTPEETVSGLATAIRASGITRVANITGLDVLGVPVFAAFRPRTRYLVVSQGKGVSAEAAKASAICEFLERWVAEYLPRKGSVESFEDFSRLNAVVPLDRLPRRSDVAVAETTLIEWIEALDLLSNERIWLPSDFVHLDQRQPPAIGNGIFPNESTGLAVGNSYVEALVHAICEVIERDAVTLWRLRPSIQNLLKIDLDTVDNPEIRKIIETAEMKNVGIAIWEATSDLGVPTFICRMMDLDPPRFAPHQAIDGSGCHPCRRLPVTGRHRGGTGSANIDIGQQGGPFHPSLCRPDQRLLEIARNPTFGTPARRSFHKAPTIESDDLWEDLDFLLDRCRKNNVSNVLAVHLSRPELNLRAARVVIPDLEDGEDVPAFVPRTRALSAYWGDLQGPR